MPIATNMAFNPSSYSTARAASSPPGFVRPSDRAAERSSPFLSRRLRAVPARWPLTENPLRADSHFCGAEVLDFCRANGLDYILGVAPTSTLRRDVETHEASTKVRLGAAPHSGKLRRFKEFYDGALSWSRVERIVARVEVGAQGPDIRFVVTNLKWRNARVPYEALSCRRGEAENHIKSFKAHLAADRSACTKATANPFRLFLQAGAYGLMWGFRVSMPKRSMWRGAQFDTLRLRLIKIAARVVEMKTMIRVHLPTSFPAQDILRLALQRIPRLVAWARRREAPHSQTRPFNPQTTPRNLRSHAGAAQPPPNANENSCHRRKSSRK